MKLLWLLTFTAIESFVIILMERGVYFFTDGVLHFTPRQNLILALGFGVVYAVGAQFSHRLTHRVGERRMLGACLLGQMLMHAWVCLTPNALVICASLMGVGLLAGLKWPVVESFVSAGRVPADQAKALGGFNLAWSIPVPLSLAVVGPLITLHPSALFLLAFMLNLVCWPLLLAFPKHPAHLEASHPDRFPESERPRLRAMLTANRYSMLASYVLLFLLAPLLPSLFAGFGVGIQRATVYAAFTDLFRVGAFLIFRQWTGWHGKLWTIPVGWIGLPLGLVCCLLGPSVGWVLFGEALFGFAAGLSYYGAIYYAMIVHDASVEAGGDHEGLIGVGFALGPGIGLVGFATGGMPGIVVGGIFLIGVTVLGGIKALRGTTGSKSATRA